MENPELRPRPTLYSILGGLLALALTAFVLLVFGALLFGCAAVNGQAPVSYTGKVTFYQRIQPPEAPRYGSICSGCAITSYWDRGTYGVVTVENGTNEPYHALLDCGMYEPTVDVPPLTSQMILVSTTMRHMDEDICVPRE